MDLPPSSDSAGIHPRSPGILSIVGMGRSGSTFLEGNLAEDFGGVAVGELLGVWGAFSRSTLCSCGEPAHACEFWQLVLDSYPNLTDPRTIEYVRQVHRDLMPIRNYPRWRRIVKQAEQPKSLPPGFATYLDEISTLHSAIASAGQQAGFQVVIDSSKHPVFYSLTEAAGAFSVYQRSDAIRLVRDPRAVAYSLARPKTDTMADGGRTSQNTYGIIKAVPYWWTMNTLADRVVPKGSVRIRYEDLGENPHRDIMNFLGYPRAKPQMNGSHQLVGNPVRHGGKHEFQRDDRWTKSNQHGSLLSSLVLYPWMRRYGYLLRDNRRS